MISYVRRLAATVTGRRRRKAPTLRTERLTIRQVRRSDADAIAATVDPTVVEANGWAPEIPAKIHRTISSGRSVGLFVLADRPAKAIVGVLEVRRPNGGALAAIGFWTVASARRRGYAGEAVTAMVERLHADGVDHVTAATFPTNAAVIALLDRAGFTRLPDGPTPRAIDFVHRIPSSPPPTG